ncbi:hypothetical protein TeGR_g5768, partial [Tetraparma gracilis]
PPPPLNRYKANYALKTYKNPFSPPPLGPMEEENPVQSMRRRIGELAPNYPELPGSFNPYADGLAEGPPRHPRPAYVLYQVLESKEGGEEAKVAAANKWQGMTEADRAPCVPSESARAKNASAK